MTTTTITSLVTPQGSTYADVSGINDAGQVVGYSMPTYWSYQAVLWQNGSASALTGLGVANGVNDQGQVIGTGYGATLGTSVATLWQNGTATSLGTLGGASSWGNAINGSGLVVGESDTASGLVDAALWQNGKAVDLGTLPGGATILSDGSSNSEARAINDLGQVAGSSLTTGNVYHAFLWQTGAMTDLGVLANGDNSFAVAINNHGLVVGYDEPDSEQSRAVMWQNGKITNLGTLPGGSYSDAEGVNDAGIVVGQAGVFMDYNHAVMWQGGTITDLNNLLAPNSGWVLTCATSVNNNGQIVGYGSFNNADANFVLTLGSNVVVAGISVQTALQTNVTTPVTVVDTASNVIAGLSGLQKIAANNCITAIDLTDVSPVALTLSAQYSDLVPYLSGNISVSVTGVTVANAAAQAGQPHVTSVSVSDSSIDVLPNLDALESLAAAGKLASITLTDPGTLTLTLTAAHAAQDAAALHAISSPYILTIAGTTATLGSFLAKEDVSGRGANGIAADYAGMAPAGGNSVVGFQSASFTGGYDAVVLDGPRSSYAIQVAANGATTIKDIGPGDASYGQTITVSGESYLVFDGGAATTVAGLPVYGSIYFVDSPANAQLAQFYAAATQFKSSIALSGLEYWENRLAAGMSLTAIAQSFLNTSYFQTTYGDPGTTHASHLAYVQTLYQNILGMSLDANNAGVQYWTSDMDNGMSGAVTLISFTNATANTSVLNAVSGATAGSGGGWLIDPTATGGYADPGLQISAQTVLSQGAAANFYNLSLVDPATVGSAGVSANGVTLTPGTITLGANAPGSTVYLSAGVTTLVAANSGNAIHDGPGADSITVAGSNNVLTLGNATADSLNIANATGTYVFNFTPGHGSLLAASGTSHPGAAILLNGTTAQVQGNGLYFGTTAWSSPVYITIGSVGGNSAAEVVAAANAAYKVSDFNGNAATGALGEHVMFLGTDSGGNAQIWAFKAASPYATADTAGAHAVTASEITLVATLIGVPATSLTAADLA